MARSSKQYEKSVAIAKDYYFSDMSVKDIGEKYNCSGNNISAIAKRFNIYDLLPPKENQPLDAILISPEYTALAIEILREYNVKFEVPRSYSIELEIESSINY